MKFTCYLGQKREGGVQDFWFDPKSQKMRLFYFAMTPKGKATKSKNKIR